MSNGLDKSSCRGRVKFPLIGSLSVKRLVIKKIALILSFDCYRVINYIVGQSDRSRYLFPDRAYTLNIMTSISR